MESAEGDLAYSVVVQTQPITNPIGLLPGLNAEALSQVATIVFQRGEDFQPGLPQPEQAGGAVINWTGNLTIAGKAHPWVAWFWFVPTAKPSCCWWLLLPSPVAIEFKALCLPWRIRCSRFRGQRG